MFKSSKKTALLVAGLVCVSLMPTALQAKTNPFSIKPVFKSVVAQNTKLKPQKVTSPLALANLLVKRKTNYFSRYAVFDMVAQPTVLSMVKTGGASGGEVAHSDTNVQVQGVDEADMVKVGDDGTIYQIFNNQVRIIKGFPLDALNQIATLTVSDSNFYIRGIYIQNNKLVVVGSSWKTIGEQPNTGGGVAGDLAVKMAPFWYWNTVSQTRVLVYDVTDRAHPTQERDIAIDGDFLDSRLIGENLYFVSRSYPNFYLYAANAGTGTKAKGLAAKPADMLPSFSDSKDGKTIKKTLALSDLSYFPDFVEPDYVLASSINVAHPEQALNTSAYLGAGELVYASQKSLYLSASKYNFSDSLIDGYFDYNPTTQIFKFAINNGQIDFKAAGEVAGTALNQFSLDENGDYFRIATTTNKWTSNGNASVSSLFVLNKDMKTVGKLENLAKGEQIYATRFMGDRCYIVTFRLVDPLFAIDLSTPAQPKVMGELKIPGYSNYLHPYDETHLIGFGKDAAVFQSEQASADQFWAGGSAFYQGIKVALFDVADMQNPKELHSVTIGDRGSQSPLLWNHKALYWDASRHLFGFPVEVAALAKGFDASQPWLYGLPTYQGAYVFEVTPETGFTLKAKLSQIPDTLKPVHVAGNGYEYSYWDSEAAGLFVDRIFSIDNSLYTLSNKQLNVYSLTDFNSQASLPLAP